MECASCQHFDACNCEVAPSFWAICVHLV